MVTYVTFTDKLSTRNQLEHLLTDVIQLPEEIIIQLEDADVYYQPRDGSDAYNRD